MDTSINALEGPLAVLREDEIRLAGEVASTLTEIGDSTDQDRSRLLDVVQDLRDLFFLVVVIGEFNAGKSTVINALLGENLLPTGITPTTEVIELIHHADAPTYKPELAGDSTRRWGHPNTGAPGVAIVDTPGTGSVFQKHEKIAKDFLHRSDLVIFVISAKRAFAETERLYLELAKNYGKKIVLVVNQIDLLKPDERDEVRRFIERQAKELLDLQPLIFMVSAKEALASGGQSGGIDVLRAHLRGVLSEAPPARQKLLSQLDLTERITSGQRDKLQGKADLVSADTAKVREVQSELQQQSLGLETQMTEARAEIDRILESVRQRGHSFIDANLSLRRLGRGAPDRDKLQADFQDVVIGRSLRDINDASSGYVNAVIDHSRLYWRGVIDRLNQLRDLMEQELTGLDAGVYAEQRENLQQAIRIAEAELKSYSTGQVVGDIRQVFQTNMNGLITNTVATMTGIVVAALAIAAHGPLIGAGAAPFAWLAIPAIPVAAVTGYAALRYYRRITAGTKRDFDERIDQLQATYRRSLDELTQKERNRLTQYGSQVLTPVFSRLEVLARRYAQQQETLTGYLERITALRKAIQESK